MKCHSDPNLIIPYFLKLFRLLLLSLPSALLLTVNSSVVVWDLEELEVSVSLEDVVEDGEVGPIPGSPVNKFTLPAGDGLEVLGLEEEPVLELLVKLISSSKALLPPFLLFYLNSLI